MTYSTPTIKCSVCHEYIFGKPPNTKKKVVCAQCRRHTNARVKFNRAGRTPKFKVIAPAWGNP